MGSLDRATDRYRLLIEQLADEEGRRRGYAGRVAERLGVTRDYVKKLEDDPGRKVGLDALTLAMDRLKLPSQFFFGAMDEPPHYRDWVGRRDEEPRVERVTERTEEFRTAVLQAKARLGMTEEEERWAMEQLDLGFAPNADTLEFLVLQRRRRLREGGGADDRTEEKRGAGRAKGYRTRKKG